MNSGREGIYSSPWLRAYTAAAHSRCMAQLGNHRLGRATTTGWGGVTDRTEAPRPLRRPPWNRAAAALREQVCAAAVAPASPELSPRQLASEPHGYRLLLGFRGRPATACCRSVTGW